MRLYLAGPMRGFPNDNYAAFEEAARSLRDLGHEVVSPHEGDAAAGFIPGVDAGTKTYMARDLPLVLSCMAVVVLPGWMKSAGAQIEVFVAKRCGMSVFDLASVLAEDPWDITANGRLLADC